MLRKALLVLWAALVIYPNWGPWALYLFGMAHFGLSILFWPLDQLWRRILKNQNMLTQPEISKIVLLRLIPPFLGVGTLMYLTVDWFGWWCFWAFFVSFVHIEVNQK